MSEVSENKKNGATKTKVVNKNTKKPENKENISKNKTVKKETAKSVKVEAPEKKQVNNKEKNQQMNKSKKQTTSNEKNKTSKVEKNDQVKENDDNYKFVSLKEIKEAIENKVNNSQKIDLIKEILLNIGIIITIIICLVILIMATRNIELNVLETDLKIFSLCILGIGILILEYAYKKDNMKIALTSLEIIVLGAINLCLIYVLKLNFNNITTVITWIGAIFTVYYVLKCLIITMQNIRKYKKDNNDIKQIIKK